MEVLRASVRSIEPSQRRLHVVLGALACIGILCISVATRHGVGIGMDPVNYIRAARSLLAGEGMQVMQMHNFSGPVPMTTWPPAFPLTLAAAGTIGIDIVAAARWINALLFGASIFLIGLLVGRHTRSTAAGLFAASLMLVNQDMVQLHMNAKSEPIFLVSAFFGIYLLERYLNEQRMALLLASAGAVGFAFLARYNGAGLVAACPLALLLLDAGSYRRRLRNAVLHGSVSSLPMVIWLIRNELVAEDRLYDTITFSLPGWYEAIEIVTSTLARFVWVSPTPGLHRIHPHAEQFLVGAAAVAFIGLVLSLVLVRRVDYENAISDGRERRQLPAILALFSIGHVAVIYACNILLFPTFLDVRKLFPAAIAVMMIAISLTYRVIRARPSWPAYIFLSVLVSMVSLGHLARSSAQIYWGYRYGVGFNNLSWSGSEMIDWARNVDPDTPLFSNYAQTVYFHTNRDVRFIPQRTGWQWKATAESGEELGPNPSYREQMSELHREINDRSALILFFHFRPVRKNLASEEELKAWLPIRELVRFKDGVVYGLRSDTADAGPRSGIE